MAKNRPLLRAGQRGRAVRAMQQGLRKALGSQAQNLANGHYGVGTIHDVTRFKEMHKIYNDGTIFGPTAWKALEKSLPVSAKVLLAPPIPKMTPESEKRAEMVREAMWVLARSGMFVYGQRRPFPTPPDMRVPRYMRGWWDCSSSSKAIYKAGGAPDPDGGTYDGWGNTWSMIAKGTWTKNPKPGDLAFYGPRASNPTHMAVCLGGGWVFSFGSTPPRRKALRYRSDFIGTKTYRM